MIREKTTLSAEGQEPERLLGEFSAATYDEWHEAALKLLKGAPFEKRMYTKSYEGITLQPIYFQQDLADVPHLDSFPGFAPYLRGNTVDGYKTTPWEVAQTIGARTPEDFQKALNQDLKKGLTAIKLHLDEPGRKGIDPEQSPPDDVGTNGVAINTPEDLQTALKTVELSTTLIFFQAGTAAISLAAFLAIVAQKRDVPLHEIRASLGMDPLGMLAIEGALPYSLDVAYKKMAALTHWAIEQAPQFRTILVDGTAYHESGGDAVQELTFAIATAVDYLRAMLSAGLTIDEVAPRVQFAFALGTNYFMEIAKLRAARVMWAKAVKAFGGNEDSQKMSIHAKTSKRNKTILDPYVNMLRATVEGFAGVIGGSESLDVGCFDVLVRTPNEFSRRIARNTQTILREEAHLDEVIDPAGGSWYVERLTDELARKAWKLFQDVEKQDGMAACLQKNIVQKQCEEDARQRSANLSTRKDVLVGTNMFANVGEEYLKPDEDDYLSLKVERSEYLAHYRQAHDETLVSSSLEKLSRQMSVDVSRLVESAIAAAKSGATLGEIEQALRVKSDGGVKAASLGLFRTAVLFERLRMSTELFIKQSGYHPQIFLLNMGPVPQHKARADFSAGFFEVGGFEVLKNQGFFTVEEAVKSAISTAAQIFVICSTDETYPELVPALTERIKASRPGALVVVAGYPKEHIDAFHDAGVDEFIHLRANQYEILQRLMKVLGILDSQSRAQDT